MERFLKSPFISVIILALLGVLLVSFHEGWLDNGNWVLFPLLLFIAGYYALMKHHNKRNPEKRIKLHTYIPYELREEDEGMQWVTFKACRKVYIFYCFAIPVGMVLAISLQDIIPYFPIWLLLSIGALQYFIYWSEIRKLELEGDG
ncbi:hypothetical protein [Sediminibacillus massiliensis]|uniref:hypothetical protein n=1 Tax=Sediminibacillus massiliensis TaxID=1926277 RepID=UPI001C4E00EA|nr:hypothetical protein [Sediminibacillus massiliensis]